MLRIALTAAVSYWLILETCLGAALAITASLFWQVSKSSPATLLRAGFRTIRLGLVLISRYAIYKITYVIGHVCGVELPQGAVAQIMNASLAIAVSLMVVGAPLPALSGLVTPMGRGRVSPSHPSHSSPPAGARHRRQPGHRSAQGPVDPCELRRHRPSFVGGVRQSSAHVADVFERCPRPW